MAQDNHRKDDRVGIRSAKAALSFCPVTTTLNIVIRGNMSQIQGYWSGQVIWFLIQNSKKILKILKEILQTRFILIYKETVKGKL